MSESDDVPESWRTLRSPKGSPEAITKAFHVALIRDAKLYKLSSAGPREGVARSLVHTIEYLNKIGIPNPVVEPLSDLALALTDLDKGVVAKLLKPASSGRGRPSAPQADQVLDAIIAAVAEGFYLGRRVHGWTLNVAMFEATKAMNASGQFPRLTQTQTKNIRTKVKSDFDCLSRDQFDTLTSSPAFLNDPLGFARRYVSAPLGAGNINLSK